MYFCKTVTQQTISLEVSIQVERGGVIEQIISICVHKHVFIHTCVGIILIDTLFKVVKLCRIWDPKL